MEAPILRTAGGEGSVSPVTAETVRDWRAETVQKRKGTIGAEYGVRVQESSVRYTVKVASGVSPRGCSEVLAWRLRAPSG